MAAPPMKYQRLTSQPENPFASLIPTQHIALIPSFTLESGVTLRNVPVAYTTRGRLTPGAADNALVVCHALSGSADVADWWGPLMGARGRAFDVTRFFVVCVNCLGSPYGTASPVTWRDGDEASGRYGPEFPLTTVRDDVRLQKLLLDDLGVRRVAAVVGGSMGGMLVLEYAFLGADYVRCIVPIATSARHSAWCISWGEAQRQSIYCDPKYEDGYYSPTDPPSTGLGAARMSALLTYRSRDSFESRFGRNIPDPSRRQNINGTSTATTAAPAAAVTTAITGNSAGSEHFAIHNEGHRRAGAPRHGSASGSAAASLGPAPAQQTFTVTDPQFHGATQLPGPSSTAGPGSGETNATSTPLVGASAFTPASQPPLAAAATPPGSASRRATTYFSAQSYLRYQGEKFIHRFDANCYIAITRKLDTHDVSRARPAPPPPPPSPQQPLPEHEATPHDGSDSSGGPDAGHGDTTVRAALSRIVQPTLVLGIETDGLFTFDEQREIASGIPGAALAKIESSEGHDAFLLQFEQVNAFIVDFLARAVPDVVERPACALDELDEESRRVVASLSGGGGAVVGVQKDSVFGEAEVEDITAW